MPHRLISVFFVALFFTFITLPHLQGRVFKLSSYPLGGYERNVIFPKFDTNSFFEGIFQQNLTRYISKKIGLRSYFVRTDNQISVSVFGQTSPKTGAQVVIGKDKTLLERAYIKARNKKFAFDPNNLKKSAEGLAQLQSYLHSKNKAFLLLISPSKVEILKENVPKEFLKNEPKALDQLNTFRKYLNELNVRYIDGPKFFDGLKSKLDFPTFSNTGTHWSYYPACLFLKEAIADIQKQLLINMLDLNCGQPNIMKGPIRTDKDLLNILNIWKPTSFLKENHYSASSVQERQNTIRPKVLLIGSSFVWQLLKYIDKYNIFTQRDYFYYFNVNHSKRGIIPQGKIDKANLNWQIIFNNKDVIMIEVNEINLNILGFGFIEETQKFINTQ